MGPFRVHQLGNLRSGYFGVKGEDRKRPSPSLESQPSPRELIGAETPPGRLGGGAHYHPHPRPPLQVNLKGAESDSRINYLTAQGKLPFPKPKLEFQQKVLQSNL